MLQYVICSLTPVRIKAISTTTLYAHQKRQLSVLKKSGYPTPSLISTVLQVLCCRVKFLKSMARQVFPKIQSTVPSMVLPDRVLAPFWLRELLSDLRVIQMIISAKDFPEVKLLWFRRLVQPLSPKKT